MNLDKFSHLVIQNNFIASDEELLERALTFLQFEGKKKYDFTKFEETRCITLEAEFPDRICRLIEQVYNTYGNWKTVTCKSNHEGLRLFLRSK